MGVSGSVASKDGEGSQDGGGTRGLDGEDGEEGGDGERASKRIRRESGDEALVEGQLRQEAAETNGAGEGDTRDDLEMEEDEVEQPGVEEDEEGEEGEEDEVSEDEVDEDEGSEGAGSGSGMDMDARLRAIQDGLGSGVDESGSEEESD